MGLVEVAKKGTLSRKGKSVCLVILAVAAVDVVAFVQHGSLCTTSQGGLFRSEVASSRRHVAATTGASSGLSASMLCSAAAAVALGMSLRHGCRGARRTQCGLFGGAGPKKELSEAEKAALERMEGEVEELQAQVEEKAAAYDRLQLELKNYRTRTAKQLNEARGKAAIP
eukprot:158248-Amphidinium_carterae.1